MPDLWMPGAIRVPSTRRVTLNNNGHRLITWHTFECAYSVSARRAAEILVQNATEAFTFHPITGEWAQTQPMNTGARTLRGGIYDTNRFGTVHQQVEVIGFASKPWTNDLTKEGKAGLARGLDFFRSWGVPDQWAFPTAPPAYPGPGVKRMYPTRSGHAYHAGWIGNTHGDPGAIRAPWEVVGKTATPQPTPSNATFRVRVTAYVLNVRSGPGTNHKVVTTVKRGEVYTIVSTQGGWGKLISGAGWIHLGYTAKI